MNRLLVIAGTLSGISALLHLACIYFGAPWYRFFGAGEQMARLAEQGSSQPTLITSGIVMVLSVWALYAFSAAGAPFRLPLMRLVLTCITLVYLVRGLAGFFLMNAPLGRSPEFWLWSSTICLIVGLFHFAGLKQQWVNL